MDNLRLKTVIPTALLLIAGVWTAGARAQDAAQTGGWVRISAFTNTPVADADVVVSRVDGKVLFEKDNVTNARGFYAAKVDPLPKNFRVTVLSDAMRLSTDVHNYDPVHGVVYVNPVTTMVSRLHDRRPELSLAEARAIIRRVLGMPANTSLGAAMRQGPRYQSPVFVESKFIQRAKAYGGFDGFLESVVTKAISHPGETELFRVGKPIPANPVSEIAGDIAIELGKGALSYLGGKGVGWAATAAGLFEPDVTAADIAQLQSQLEDLQSSVDALSNQLAQSTKEIEAAINFADYNTLATQQLKLAGQVNQVEQDVSVLADGCPPATSSPAPPLSKFCKSQKVLVASELSESEIHASFEEFSAALEDTAAAGTKGMLHLFSLFTGQTVGHYFRYGDSLKIWDMWGYWYSVEVQAANLKVELWHLQDAEDNPAGQKELNDFTSENTTVSDNLPNVLNAEADLVYPIIPQGEVVNTYDGYIWMTTYPGTAAPPACKLGLSSPPNGQGGAGTGPQLGSGGKGFPVIPYPGDAETTWFSPSVDQLSSLIKDYTGTPGGYLNRQTDTKPDDPPEVTSIPFVPGLDTVTNPGCVPNGPWAWTRTPVDPNKTSSYFVINLNSGAISPTNSTAGNVGMSNWTLLVGQFVNQYYWTH